MKYRYCIGLLLVLISLSVLQAQTTAIPDANFEQALIDAGIDSDGLINGEVLTKDINTITQLNIQNRSIDSLTGIEDFVSLEVLDCANNNLTALAIENNTALTNINCSLNQLEVLDIRSNALLTDLVCTENNLTRLYLNNGNNTALNQMDATLNPGLECIEVDDLLTIGGSWKKDNTASYSEDCHYGETFVPDDAFENELIGLGYDAGELDDYVVTDSINQVTDLSVFNKGITDLTGIEAFEMLENLNCSNNLIALMDVSQNAMLTELNCASNKLTVLNVESNSSLETLICGDNLLSAMLLSNNEGLKNLDVSRNQLDALNLSANDSIVSLRFNNNRITNITLTNITQLEELQCANNQLTQLNVSNNSSLTSLLCGSNQISNLNLGTINSLTTLDVSNNQISTLDVSSNVALSSLTCSENRLTIIDLKKNAALTLLSISDNELTTLDLSRNTTLESVACSSNQIRNLDLSINPLTTLDCSQNPLNSLNIKNGNNQNLTILNAAQNPGLSCIEIDDITTIGDNWFKDERTSYSENCAYARTFVPDDAFEQALIDLGYDSGPLDDFVPTENILIVSDLDVSNLGINDLTGVEDFTALSTLDCSDNDLQELYVSNNPLLSVLNCSNNQLLDLDLSTNTSLISLDCSNNSLNSLNIKNGNNDILGSLDATANPDLGCIEVDDAVAALAASWQKDTESFYSEDCRLLRTYVPDDAFELALAPYDNVPNDDYIPTAAIEKLTSLDLSNLGITDLTGIVDFKVLATLDCSNNSLTSMDLSRNTLLNTLSCQNNLFTGLDLSKNVHLSNLDAANNLLASLNIKNGNNRNLVLDATGNANLLCIEVDNPSEAQGFPDWQKDNGTSYSSDCPLANTFIPDDAFEQALIDLGYDAGPLDNYVSTATVESITALDISNLQIANLSGIEDFKALEILNCSSNTLNNLDVSSNTALRDLNCSSNALNSLRLNNGNNTSLLTLNATGNAPSLICIEVDDADEAEGYADWQKDESVVYSENCHPDETFVPDDAFEQALIDLGYDSGPLDNYVLTADINTVTSLSVNGKLDSQGNSLSDLTGIEDFTALETLDCSSNLLSHLDISNNLNLTSLTCGFNQLNNLDISNNTALITLICNDNSLEALDVSAITGLVELDCQANLLESLIIANGNNSNLVLNASNNPNLLCIQVDEAVAENGVAGWQKDTTASYSANCFPTETNVPDDAFEQALIDLGYDDGPLDDFVPKSTIEILTSLDVSGLEIEDLTGIEDFIALEVLDCSSNELTMIDLSSNVLLTTLNCANNQLETLDVRNNTALVSLDCQSNLLSSLNVRNGNNMALGTLIATDNPDLFCIQVDDTAEALAATGWQKDNSASYSENCEKPRTYVPDDAFEQALINLGYDSGPLDNFVVTSNISNIAVLDIQSSGITDLNGIEGFTALTTLICNNNQLVALDVSGNRVLTVLNCDSNNLENLDLSKNIQLTSVDCSANKLVSLNLQNGNNVNLTLDTTGNPNLSCIKVDDVAAANSFPNWQKDASSSYSLNCAPALTYIPDAAFEQALIDLGYDNELDDYVASSAINAITDLNVSGQGITNLAGIEDFKNLQVLDCSDNGLNNLDLRLNTALSDLNCSTNELTSLNLKNTTIATLNATGNPDLLCIEVDDPVAATNDPNWQEDVIATYSQDCHPAETYVPDDAFEQALIDLGYDSGPPDNYLATAAIDTVTVLIIPGEGILNLEGLEGYILNDPDTEDINDFIISGDSIVDLTGIESFSALTTLVCPGNGISKLDLGSNTNLTALVAAGNQLNTLDVSPNTALTTLELSFNQLYDLDVSSNVALENLAVAGNQLEKLDVSTNTALVSLECAANRLTALDVSNNPGIEALDISFNQFPVIDLTNLAQLKVFRADFNQLTALNPGNNPELEILTFGSNYISAINTQNLDSLQILQFPGNKISSLNLTANLELIRLDAGKNKLINLNVSSNTNLIELYSSSNHITNLTPAGPGNLNLKVLNVADNELQGINSFITNYPALESLNNADNKILDLDLSITKDIIDVNCSNNFIPALDITSNLSLEILDCNSNEIEDINIDSATYDLLTKLSCDDNQISALITDQFVALTTLSCSRNELENLNLLNNSTLDTLNFEENRLTNIDLTSNINLLAINGSNNKLDTLALNTNTLLKSLTINNNTIGGINLDQNTGIEILDISGNEMTEIELGLLSNLEEFQCSSNLISTLNLSANDSLRLLGARSNLLTQLNIKNGNNVAIETLDATDNENLVCIEVDDAAFAESSEGWQKDTTAAYNVDCHYFETFVPDDGFEQALTNLGLDSGPLDDYVLTATIEVVQDLNVSSNNIQEMTGLQDFKALETLNISSNQIDSLDISNNMELESLNASGNQLDTLDLIDNTALKVLIIASNQFQTITVNDLTGLQEFDCSSNLITDLDLSFNTALTEINVSSNVLVSLKLKNGNNTSINNMDATGNPDLLCIEVDDAAFSQGATGWLKDAIASYNEFCHFYETFVPDDAFEQALIAQGYDYNVTDPLDDYVPTAKIENLLNLNISNRAIADLTGLEDFTSLTTLNCSNNVLVSLDISNNQALENLNCSGNLLTVLDISSNASLTDINISDNQFTDLDIGSSANLATLNCSANLLPSADFSAYPGLTTINCSSNQLTTLIFNTNSLLRSLECSSNELTAIDITPNTNMESLKCRSNRLITMDANNGLNGNLLVFDVRDNPDLRCILIDDVIQAETNELGGNWRKDASAAYKLECNDDDNDGVLDVNDNCPNTRFGDSVDLFGCTYVILAPDNFSILTTSETCRSSNNGKINITAVQILNYKASIEVNGNTKEYNFTNQVEIRNLRAGTYELCLTIEEEPDYNNCYELLIGEPEDLLVTSTISRSEEKISMKFSGGTNYIIDVNGLVFGTSENDISLALKKGNNTIKVKTDAECQGTFEQSIFIAEALVYFPNPIEDNVTLLLGNDPSMEVEIKIHSLGGQLLYSKPQVVQDGVVQLDVAQLAAGIYSLTLKTKMAESTFKIVKK